MPLARKRAGRSAWSVRASPARGARQHWRGAWSLAFAASNAGSSLGSSRASESVRLTAPSRPGRFPFPVPGSSRTMILGCTASARAIPIRWQRETSGPPAYDERSQSIQRIFDPLIQATRKEPPARSVRRGLFRPSPRLTRRGLQSEADIAGSGPAIRGCPVSVETGRAGVACADLAHATANGPSTDFRRQRPAPASPLHGGRSSTSSRNWPAADNQDGSRPQQGRRPAGDTVSRRNS